MKDEELIELARDWSTHPSVKPVAVTLLLRSMADRLEETTAHAGRDVLGRRRGRVAGGGVADVTLSRGSSRADALKALRAGASGFAAELEPVYAVLRWEWGLSGREGGVPDRKKILGALHRLLGEMERNGSLCAVESGGLEVRFDKKEGVAQMAFTRSERVYLDG